MAKDKPKKEEKDDKFELVCGIILALFAAVLALAGLGGNNTGKGQMVAQTEKGSAYEWYNSKSIKQSLVKGQLDSLELAMKSGAISGVQMKFAEENMDRLKKSADRYEAAGMEILEGSQMTALKKIEIPVFENEILPKIKLEKDRKFIRQYYSKDNENKFYVLRNKTDFLTVGKIFKITVENTGYKSQGWVQDLNGEYGVITGANEWYERSNAIADADGIFDKANLFLQLCLVLGAISLVLKESKIKVVIFSLMIFVGIIGTFFTVSGFIASNGIL
jgi:hypothetical protein